MFYTAIRRGGRLKNFFLSKALSNKLPLIVLNSFTIKLELITNVFIGIKILFTIKASGNIYIALCVVINNKS